MSTVIDVHAHYLPEAAFDEMTSGIAVVSRVNDGDLHDCIELNGMRVGTTAEQITSLDSMLRAMDAVGVERRVISPPPFTYRYWSSPEDALRLHRILNDATAAAVAAHPDRFTGLATAPFQAPDAAIAELERATRELGLSGVTVGTNIDGRTVAEDGPRDVLEHIVDLGVPVLMHPDFVPQPRLASHYLINLIGMPTESAIVLANLVVSGTLERLPDLRICFVHGGGSFPALLGRLDKGWNVRPETRASTSRPPSEQLSGVFFDSLTHSPRALRYLIDLVGPEHVVVGTDAPFDVEEPDPVGRLRQCPGLTEAEEHEILARSPLRWLHGERGQ